MARAQVGTIRLRLLDIGAATMRNICRECIHRSGACPGKATLMHAAPGAAPESRAVSREKPPLRRPRPLPTIKPPAPKIRKNPPRPN